MRSSLAALGLVLATAVLPAPALGASPDRKKDRGVGRDLSGQSSDGRGYVPAAHPDGAFGSDYVGDERDERRERKRALRDEGADPDWDGVRTLAEVASGTDPLEEDTDDDGYRDGEEDPDRDGLKSEDEEAAGLDPGQSDSDGDGTSDDRQGAGRIVAMEGSRLELESFDDRGERTALVDSATRIECGERDSDDAALTFAPCRAGVLSEGVVLHSSQVEDAAGGPRLASVRVSQPLED